jgi:hypothetical protein
VATDNFDRDDANTLGSSWTPLGDAVFGIRSNQAARVSGTGRCVVVRDDVASGDVVLKFVVTEPDTAGVRAVIRANAGGTSFLEAFYSVGGAYTIINEVVSGSETAAGSFGTPGSSVQAGDLIEFRAEGSALEFWRTRGGTRTQIGSGTSTLNLSANRHGFCIIGSTAVRYDDFELTAIGGGPPVAVDVTPEPVTLTTGQTQQFSASVTNATDTSVTWTKVSGVGSINGSGLYSAGSTPGSAVIRATSVEDNTKFDDVDITVNAPAIVVDVTPEPATVTVGSTVQFSAAVTNASDPAVTWSVEDGGGTISGTGLYSPPGAAGTATIRATSDEDPTKFDDVTVTIEALTDADYIINTLKADLPGLIRTELAVELARIDAAISSRLATAGYTVPPTAGAIADAVHDEDLSGHTTAGSGGKALADAAAAGGATAAYTGTIATASNGGTGGVGIGTYGGTPPAFSTAGYTIGVNGAYYEVATHTSGQAAFTLTEAWRQVPSGTPTVTAEYLGSTTIARAATATAVVNAWRSDTPPFTELTDTETPTNAQIMGGMAALAMGAEDNDEEADTYTRMFPNGAIMRVFDLVRNAQNKIKGRS